MSAILTVPGLGTCAPRRVARSPERLHHQERDHARHEAEHEDQDAHVPAPPDCLLNEAPRERLHVAWDTSPIFAKPAPTAATAAPSAARPPGINGRGARQNPLISKCW